MLAKLMRMVSPMELAEIFKEFAFMKVNSRMARRTVGAARSTPTELIM